MRALKIVFGLVSGLFAGFEFRQFGRVLQQSESGLLDLGSPTGLSVLAGCLVGFVLSVVVCAMLLASAFSKRRPAWLEFDLGEDDSLDGASSLDDAPSIERDFYRTHASDEYGRSDDVERDEDSAPS